MKFRAFVKKVETTETSIIVESDKDTLSLMHELDDALARPLGWDKIVPDDFGMTTFEGEAVYVERLSVDDPRPVDVDLREGEKP